MLINLYFDYNPNLAIIYFNKLRTADLKKLTKKDSKP